MSYINSISTTHKFYYDVLGEKSSGKGQSG